MQTIKIDFCDFWGGFDKHNNYFTALLKKKYNVIIDSNPDFLIYSCFGFRHLTYNCCRIFYTGENIRPNWNGCDYAFSFDWTDHPNHYRLPLFLMYDDPHKLEIPKPDPRSILAGKTKFCNMVVSGTSGRKGVDFFHKLSAYKKVDSGGRFLNNIGGPVKNKREFIRDYKFTFAFENASFPGYTTEKIMEAMLEQTIPIYWGNPLINRDFNPKSFINANDYRDDEALLARIRELDENDELYMKMLAEPWLNEGRIPGTWEESSILGQFEKIFTGSNKRKPVAQTFKKYVYFVQVLYLKIKFRFYRVFFKKVIIK